MRKDRDVVNYIFKENPELVNIGTKNQYEEYLKTIFPESKVKNVVYHQTPKKFGEFNANKSRTGGIYFSPFNRRAGIFRNYTKAAILNINNPFIISKKQNKKFERYLPNMSKLSKNADLTNYDGVVGFSNVFYDKGQLDSEIINVSSDKKNNIEFVAFNTDQIHVLGSQKDIAGFKEHVNKNKKENSLEKEVASSTFIVIFIFSLFLISPNITGNVVGNMTKLGSNLLGVILFLSSISGFFAYRKLKS